jgi:hypothetical protein
METMMKLLMFFALLSKASDSFGVDFGVSRESVECTQDWQLDLSTDGVGPKGMSGDTHTAYGVFSFYGEKGLRLVMQGRKPANARFFSVQNYWSRLFLDRLDLFKLDQESSVLIDEDLSQDFSIELAERRSANNAAVEGSQYFAIRPLGVQVVMIRIYAPFSEVRAETFPRVFALRDDDKTPKCPRLHQTRFTLNAPQLVGRLAPKHKELKFGKQALAIGSNRAIPGYVVSLAEIAHDKVSVIWIKAPRVGQDVRYWSFCTQNFLQNTTLNCLADQAAVPKIDDWVGVIVGQGDDIRACALKQNLHFLEDLRESKQKLAGFVYRNILPSAEFLETNLYSGEYLPSGTVYDRQEFLESFCQ